MHTPAWQGRQGRLVGHPSAAARRNGFAALADRTGIDTADVDDIIWGCSSQRGPQSGDLGRMSARCRRRVPAR
jgi:acetyl-CoA acetyltransferase